MKYNHRILLLIYLKIKHNKGVMLYFQETVNKDNPPTLADKGNRFPFMFIGHRFNSPLFVFRKKIKVL